MRLVCELRSGEVRDDRQDSSSLVGGRRVDRRDAPQTDGALYDDGVGLPRLVEIGRVSRSTGHFGAAVNPRKRLSDRGFDQELFHRAAAISNARTIVRALEM